MAGKARARNQAEREAYDADQDARISDLEAQQAQQGQGYPQQDYPQQPPPQDGGPSMLDQLNSLTELHNSGALTDEEFSAAKAKLLS